MDAWGIDAAEAIPWLTRATSTLVVVLLCYGLWNRRRRRIHIPLMVTCFAIDLIDVVIIEVSRILIKEQGAVGRSVESLSTGGFDVLDVHIVVSLTTLLCYAVALFTGIRLHRRGAGRKSHKRNACVFIVARLANYVTSFFV